jgi:LIM-domain binding protein
MGQKDIVLLHIFKLKLKSSTFTFTAIGRTLIPRYFRSIFEGGVTELYFNMKHSKESFHNTSITLDCEQCTMVTHHGKPTYTKVSDTIFVISCIVFAMFLFA